MHFAPQGSFRPKYTISTATDHGQIRLGPLSHPTRPQTRPSAFGQEPPQTAPPSGSHKRTPKRRRRLGSYQPSAPLPLQEHANLWTFAPANGPL
jgi:hypothetical protein